MSFTGRIYWQEYHDAIRYWDSTTGAIATLVVTDPALPSAVSNAGYFGNLTLLPDGRIHSYLNHRFGSPTPWASVFNADLDPTSGETWAQPAVPQNYNFSDGAQIVTDTAGGVIWVPWYQSPDNGFTGTLLESFDSTGTPVEQKQAFNDTWPAMSNDWNASSTFGNGVLAGSSYYRVVLNGNWIDRFDLTTGAWSITRAGYFGVGGVAPVGVLNSGEVAYVTITSTSPQTAQICTITGDPWVPIDTSSPVSAPTPSLAPLGSGFEISWPGAVQIHDDHAYYPQGGWTDARWVEQDLTTGVETTLFGIPEVVLLVDGTPTTFADPNWYYDFGNGSAPQGAILVPGVNFLTADMSAEVGDVTQSFVAGK